MKNNRISFRISDDLDKRIKEQIKNNSKIKSRSDFGINAIEYYLAHLQSIDTEYQLMKKAILAIADKLEIKDLPEIIDLKDI